MSTIPLIKLQQGFSSEICKVVLHNNELVVKRLKDFGFLPGAPIKMIAHTPFKKGPCVVKLGMTRFALRYQEAACILISENIMMIA